MKNKFIKFAALLLTLSLTACSAAGEQSGEIQIPIYGAEDSFKTVEVKRMDLSGGENVAAFIGYAFSDALSTAASGNLVSFKVSKYQELKAGDVIAEIDSSALSYTYQRQEIMANAAYEAYLASGSESARLEYEYEKARLDAIQYEIDCYTITAPYDCVITDLAVLTEGEELRQGTYVCSVAYADQIYVYIQQRLMQGEESKFKLGAKVNVTLTGNSYEGTVISVPESGTYRYPLRYADMYYPGDNSIRREYQMFSPDSGPTSADSSNHVIIGFEPEVLEQLLIDTPNAVVAGWATVAVTTSQMCGVLAVPASAVSNRGSTYVYLYQDGQRLQTPVITAGTINGYTVIIGGLQEGDLIIA